MATATIVPPPRPKILLEMDHDEAEVVLSMLAKTTPEQHEHATRRMNIVRALDAAGVKEIDVPLVRSKEIGNGREPVGNEEEGNVDE